MSAGDMQLDDLLAELSQFPAGYLENFDDMPEFGGLGVDQKQAQTILGYGENFGGVDQYNGANDVFGVFNNVETTKSISLDAGKQPGGGKKRPPAEHVPEFCEKCCLVPAEVDCPDCSLVLCAFCDFETHSSSSNKAGKGKACCAKHSNRVLLDRTDEQGNSIASSAALKQLWQLEGMQPAQPSKAKAKAKAKAKTLTKQSRKPDTVLSNGNLSGSNATHIRLDDQIMEFFKTEEFASAVSKVADSANTDHYDLGMTLNDVGDETDTGPPTQVMSACAGIAKRKTSSSKLTVKPAKSVSAITAKKRGDSRLSREAAKRAAAHAAAAAAAAAAAKAAAKAAEALTEDCATAPENFIFRMEPGPAGLSGAEIEAWRGVRRCAIERWKHKKLQAKLNPKVRYRSRKKIADCRPRVKGRFVKTSELVTAS